MGWCGSQKWCCGLKSWWYVVGSFVKSLWSLPALLLLFVFVVGLLPLCCIGVPLFLATLVFTDWLAEREVRSCARYMGKDIRRPRRQGDTTNEDAWAAVTNGSVESIREALGDLWGRQGKFDVLHVFLKFPLSILGFAFAALSVAALLVIPAAPLVWLSCGQDCLESICFDMFWFFFASCKDFPYDGMTMSLIASGVAAVLVPVFMFLTAVLAALEMNLARWLLCAKYVTDEFGQVLVETSVMEAPTAAYQEPPSSQEAGRICRRCGNVLPVELVFCANCGTELGKTEAPPAAELPSPASPLAELPAPPLAEFASEAVMVPVRYSAPPAPGAAPGTAPDAGLGNLETPASWAKLAQADPGEKSDRHAEVQKMLQEADPADIVGLSIQVGDAQGTVTDFTDGCFRVLMVSGEVMTLDKIEAEHVVAWLNSQGA